MVKHVWQLYDEQGYPKLDGGAPKLQAILQGLLHGSAHLWLWRMHEGKPELLLQKRASGKINWPGRYDKSAGGHILYEESPLHTALRKAHGELNLELVPEQLQFVGVHRWYSPVSGTDLIENEYQWVYMHKVANPPVNVPTHEVESVVWRVLDAIQAETTGEMKLYVPYGAPYFSMLCEAVTQANT